MDTNGEELGVTAIFLLGVEHQSRREREIIALLPHLRTQLTVSSPTPSLYPSPHIMGPGEGRDREVRVYDMLCWQ